MQQIRNVRTALGIAIVATMLVLVAPASARNWQDGIQDSIGSGSSLMVYRYYLPPDYDDTIDYPLVLSLHGAGQTGTNNVTQVSNHIGPLLNVTEFEHPAILVAPQLPTSSGWGPLNSRDRTPEILDRIVDDFAVDTNRMYVTGLSMGGFGTMQYLHSFNVNQPDGLSFAAAVPLSGAYALPSARGQLGEIPIWMAHGSADTVVSPNTSRNTFRIIAQLLGDDPIPFEIDLLGGPTAIDDNLRYTELVGRGHNIWSRVYAQDELYEWMFSQSLVPEPSAAIQAIVCLMGGASLLRLPRKGRVG